MAEALIVLGIIGVISVLSLPSVIGHYKRIVILTGVKKFYAEMNQAIIAAEDEFGDSKYWKYPKSIEEGGTVSEGAKVFKNYFGNYLQYEKIVINTGTMDKVYENSVLKYLDNCFDIYLKDGAIVHTHYGNGLCYDFKIDANGDAPPNKPGMDMFTFLLCEDKNYNSWQLAKDEKLIPGCGSTCRTREGALNKCKEWAFYCGALLRYDNWEFKEDYPYKF